MVVNLLGNPNDFGFIRTIAEDKDIIIIEDNCESMGASFEANQQVPWSVGSYSSFFSSHFYNGRRYSSYR